MEVILKEDVQKLGRAGDQVKVADGYGRNFLLPKKMAVLATPENKKRLEQELNSKKGQAKRMMMDARYLAQSIEVQPIIIKMAAGEGGKLFGAVTSTDIEKALAQRDITVDKRKIELEEPLKQLGQFEVAIKIHPDVTAKLTVLVEDEHKKSEPAPVAKEEPVAAEPATTEQVQTQEEPATIGADLADDQSQDQPSA